MCFFIKQLSINMKKVLLIVLMLLPVIWTQAQHITYQNNHTIRWMTPDTVLMQGYEASARMSFEDATYAFDNQQLPQWSYQLPVHDQHLQASFSLNQIQCEAVPQDQLVLIEGLPFDTAFVAYIHIGQSRETPLVNIVLTPIRRNPRTSQIERLVSFSSVIKLEDNPYPANYKTSVYGSNSVLAEGHWYKFKIKTSGIFKLGWNDLQAAGINPANINPANIRIYANGGGPLPEKNSAARIDDLFENPVEIVGGNDGRFDQNDYILFYGNGPVTWDYNPYLGHFLHHSNYYDDYSYLFFTTDLGPGKRIPLQNNDGTPTITITDFMDYQVHEKDEYNLSNTGRTWYGDLFDLNLENTFTFSFPNAVVTKEAYMISEFASRNFSPANFRFFANGIDKGAVNMETTTATGYSFAKGKSLDFTFLPTGDDATIKMQYVRSASSSRGWLDYMTVNMWRQLVFTGPQMSFANPTGLAEGKVASYQLSNAGQEVSIWDVTNPVSPEKMSTNLQGNTLSFTAPFSSLRQYIAFDGTSYQSVEVVGKVDNQNLHGIKNIDYLIITHPDFMEQAMQLAQYHQTHSGLSVFVTTPALIYNEFSSGAQDVTAIRDFARMLYLNSDPGRELKYLLLFGDASFDYKDRIGGNTNFVPTWQSVPSLNIVSSIATDDYYGYLGENEGGDTADLLDIGIGRLPVSKTTQASEMVAKVIAYGQKNDLTNGPWRNTITFVADDSDGNLHMNDAENLYRLIDTTIHVVNVDKIYLDAYQQKATPSGQKAPEVNLAINKRIEKGSLIMNYSGHGGEVGWSHERTLEIADINSWRNIDKLPVFITATCEFSRYDDPTRTSAGELVILNPKGGAIGMFTTARATYASANLILNKAIFQNNIFSRTEGEYPRFGDVIRRSKLRGDANDRKFILLGDPAVRLALPELNVETTAINGNPVGSVPDTLKALSMVSISGRITDDNGVLMSDYQGVLYPTVYDKASEITTKGDETGYPQAFILRNSVIYNGKVEIKNGLFDFSFMIPKDIAYLYGKGRISYYATNLENDAHGYYEDFVVGGFSDDVAEDLEGPTIRLFMNDSTFVNGGTTNENPVLFALVEDVSGINTTGNGIGHDIVAYLSGETENTVILNDYYEALLNRQASGIVTYPFNKLNPGKHTLKLKVWDVFNNSSEASIDFLVVNSNSMTLSNLKNFPNPFADQTTFVFDHNQSGNELRVELNIFDLAGRQIRTIKQQLTPTTYQTNVVSWDGCTDAGQKISKGLYLYRLKVVNEEGASNEISSKLIFYQ